MADHRSSGAARSRRDSARKAPAFSFEDEMPPKSRLRRSLASASTSEAAPDGPKPTSFSLSSGSMSLLLYKALLEEELKEGSSQQNKSIFLGLLSLAASAFAAAARPDLVAPAFLLFAFTALPVRAASFARRKWGYFMLDFCYFANAAVAAWLLLSVVGEERGIGRVTNGEDMKSNNNVKAAVVALAEGPLAAAALAWRCSWCPGMPLSHLVSTLVHVLPGAALFAKEVAAAAVPAAPAARTAAQHEQQPPNYFLWSLQYQFLAPLCFYLAWQIFYFLVVQVVCRESILANGHDTSYRCLARRAARADNVWNLLVRGREPCERSPGSLRPAGSSSQVDEKLGLTRGTTAARRCLAFGGVQLAFTISTLAAAALVTSHSGLWTVWQAVKFAAPLWYGVEATARYRGRAAERRVERAVAAAASAAAAVK